MATNLGNGISETLTGVNELEGYMSRCKSVFGIGPFDDASETDPKKYPFLFGLGIPLGINDKEQHARGNILRELLLYNENHRLPHKYESQNNKIKYVLKMPGFNKFPTLRDLEHKRPFMPTLIGLLTMTSRGQAGDEELSADLLCEYLAKHHHSSFLKSVDMAKACEEKQNKKRKWTPPDDLVMYDDSDPTVPFHVKWNVMYGELLEYKGENGHCRVPAGKGGARTNLAQFVSHQRTNFKTKAPCLTPRRCELLESIDFDWVANPDQYHAVDDPKYHNAVAAKLFYQPSLTAKEALLLAGFDEERATNDSMKKYVNQTVAEVKKKPNKKSKIRPKVELVLCRLKAARTVEEGVKSVFGETEIAEELMEAEKLVPREDGNSVSLSTARI
jgi:hypothetical protein